MELRGTLKGKVAVVTGGSRGVGRGIALGLGEAGATVYVTGRTTEKGTGPFAGSILETAEEITRLGGEGIAVRVDHRSDAEVQALFTRIASERKTLDILVNNVFLIPDGPLHGVPFWEQPISIWDDMHAVGLRSHYVASVYAAPLMITKPGGLIVNVSSIGGLGFALNVAYGVGKAGVDRLAADMAHDLRPHGITVVSLWPGVVSTERVMATKDSLPFSIKHAESPQFSGRAVAALAGDPKRMDVTGSVVVSAELGELYGFTDLDGSRPRSLRKQIARAKGATS
ncbi:MAG: SDR family NAD(P)-dependent oxidoreductase [Polyangiaceae bacterium]